MERGEYDTIREVEDSHWWYQGLRELTLEWLERLVPPGPEVRVLDAGCGTGGLLAELVRRYPSSVGVDLSVDAIEYTRGRGLRALARGSVETLPFATGSFDVVVSNDVIYHGDAHERPALEEFHRVLRPGGALLMNLPALESLRGAHDVVVHTRRRFQRGELLSLLGETGFTPARVTYRNALLFPIAWVVRKLRPVRSDGCRSDLRMPSGLINGALHAVLRLENRMLDLTDLPCGLSLFCHARRSA